ncbi:MAG: SRPBCC domain-containing protein [Brachybacterium sp.]|nr:SRPBCC domain-containing protein [Brachybacterium sp.]
MTSTGASEQHLPTIDDQLAGVTRAVERENQDWTVILAQTLPAARATLWRALTDPETLRLFFLPVTGQLHEGGAAVIDAMGVTAPILTCEPEQRIVLDWGGGSRLELRLADADGAEPSDAHAPATRVTLRHTVRDDDHFAQFGPAATGTGWDGALYGLALHVADPVTAHAERMGEQFPFTEDGRRFTRASTEQFATAHIAAGGDPDDARARAARTAAFYLGEAPSEA